MSLTATPCSTDDVLALREQRRQEMNCQVVHDSIHRRQGWTKTFLLSRDEKTAGFGSIAIAGPWTDKPTVFEFYVVPEHRDRVFDLFEVVLAASAPRFITIQSNDLSMAVMLHTFARDVHADTIVFHDRVTTTLPSMGSTMNCQMSEDRIRQCIDARDGGPEWQLELNGETVGTGGILFHYNRPYGDIYMDIVEPYRRRGFGSYLVQELKREAYELGCVPAARCGADNVASRKTLQKAGLAPYANLLTGTIAGA